MLRQADMEAPAPPPDRAPAPLELAAMAALHCADTPTSLLSAIPCACDASSPLADRCGSKQPAASSEVNPGWCGDHTHELQGVWNSKSQHTHIHT